MSTRLEAQAPPFRFAEISQREAFGDLLDQGFGVSGGKHFFEDFPIWDPVIVPSGPKLVRLGAWDRDRLIASAGLRLADLMPGRLPVALIGAVATDPAFRGRGIASYLTEQLLARATDAGAAMALLWGSEHRMYERLGFQLSGSQIRVPLSKLRLNTSAPGAFKADGSPVIVRGWSDALFTLLRSRPRGIALSDGDLAWYRAHRNVAWYRAERNGQILAYAALGRGIDLGNIVHEWGGEESALTSLLETIRVEHPEAELLGPADEKAFGLDEHPTEKLALIRLLKGTLPAVWVWGLDAV